MPIGMAIRYARMIERMSMPSVTQIRSPTLSITGFRSVYDMPKSSVTTPFTQFRYCSGTDLSSPSSLRTSLRDLSVASRSALCSPPPPFPRIMSTGSPGASLLIPKVTSVIAISVGMKRRMRFSMYVSIGCLLANVMCRYRV
jgi:hypothetical protein